MTLTFGGACPYRTPTHQISNILGAYQIKVFDTCRYAQRIDVEQNSTCGFKTSIDVKTVVHIRIIDQPFPANGGTGFFKINAHDQQQIILQTRFCFFQ